MVAVEDHRREGKEEGRSFELKPAPDVAGAAPELSLPRSPRRSPATQPAPPEAEHRRARACCHRRGCRRTSSRCPAPSSPSSAPHSLSLPPSLLFLLLSALFLPTSPRLHQAAPPPRRPCTSAAARCPSSSLLPPSLSLPSLSLFLSPLSLSLFLSLYLPRRSEWMGMDEDADRVLQGCWWPRRVNH